MRSTTSGQFGLLSQFPRTTVSRGPTARSSSRTTSVQTSPRCHTSSASLASSFTFCGKRLCVSAITKMRNASFEFFWFVMSHLSLLAVACLRQHTRPSTHARWIRNGFCRHRTPEKRKHNDKAFSPYQRHAPCIAARERHGSIVGVLPRCTELLSEDLLHA